jgi:hypothetical protein
VAQQGKAASAASEAATPPFKFWFWGQIFDLLRSQGRYLIVAAAVVLCVYFMTSAVRSFAGEVTIASVTLRLLANIILKWSLTATVSGLSLALYFREKRQHERTRERLAKRVTELELQIDRTRTSSNLTAKGRTRKEDQ